MTQIRTPKIGKYGSTIYYYQQKYVNWDYVATSSYDDIIMVDIDSNFTTDYSRNILTGSHVYGDTEISMQALRYMTEDGYKNRYFTVDISITSSYPIFLQLLDLYNSLPFPSNFQANIDTTLSPDTPTYRKLFNFQYVDPNAINQNDTITVRYKLPRPYPITLLDLKYLIPKNEYTEVIPFATAFPLVKSEIVSKSSGSTTRIALINAVFIQRTPTNYTSFDVQVSMQNTGYRSVKNAPSFISNVKLRHPPCVKAESFQMFENGWSFTSVQHGFQVVSFISSTYKGTN